MYKCRFLFLRELNANPVSLMSLPEWPASRCFPFERYSGLQRLSEAWSYSREMITETSRLLRNDRLSDDVVCVAVSGSLSRMEAHQASDVDVLVVIDDSQTDVSAAAAQLIYDRVWNTVTAAVPGGRLKRPKPGGIFSTVARMSALTNPDSRGIVDEEMTSYGQRMQLLMDSQPILGHSGFDELQAQLLHWYSEHRVKSAFREAGPFHWLWQDIQRYWRSIRSRACWLHADEPQKSLEVNLKLRSSRLAIVAAMLWAIERCHAEGSPDAMIRQLLSLLRQTPAERLARAVGEEFAGSLLSSYQSVWTCTSELSPDDVRPSREVLKAIDDFKAAVCSAINSSSDWMF